MIPVDTARVMAGTDADAAGLEDIREKYGLKDPVPVQYLRWVGLALRGDLGESIRTRASVTGTVAKKLRSEEHTSELQSRLHLVCCLLLEKKKSILQLISIGYSLR